MRNRDRAIEPYASLLGKASDFYVADKAGVSVWEVRAFRERLHGTYTAEGASDPPPSDDPPSEDLPPEPEPPRSLEEEFGDEQDLAPLAADPPKVDPPADPEPQPAPSPDPPPPAPVPAKRGPGRPRKVASEVVAAPARRPPVRAERHAWRVTLESGEVRIILATDAVDACQRGQALGRVARAERLPDPLLD
jgi:hypothetical protein